MKDDQEKINTVLAMFDPEDIPYINPQRNESVECEKIDKIIEKVLNKRIGEYKNDR